MESMSTSVKIDYHSFKRDVVPRLSSRSAVLCGCRMFPLLHQSLENDVLRHLNRSEQSGKAIPTAAGGAMQTMTMWSYARDQSAKRRIAVRHCAIELYAYAAECRVK